jgi:hypothetical protein
MADGVAFTWDNTKALAALDLLTQVVARFELGACGITAQNIAAEARSRVAKRGPNPTNAQLGRPPIDQLIRVEALANGTGYVVIVQEPSGDAEYLPFYLEMGGPNVFPEIGKRPFFFSSGALEKPAHERRVNEAAQAAIDLVSQ